jgi:hypothetical protein
MHGPNRKLRNTSPIRVLGFRIIRAPAHPKVAMIYPTSFPRRRSQPNFGAPRYIPVVIGDCGLRATTELHQHEHARLGAEAHYAQGAADPHVSNATANLPDNVVVSNDRYREYCAAYPWLSTRPSTFMLIGQAAQ